MVMIHKKIEACLNDVYWLESKFCGIFEQGLVHSDVFGSGFKDTKAYNTKVIFAMNERHLKTRVVDEWFKIAEINQWWYRLN